MLESLLSFSLMLSASSTDTLPLELFTQTRTVSAGTTTVRMPPVTDPATVQAASYALSRLFQEYHINCLNEASNETTAEERALTRVEAETNEMPDGEAKEARKNQNTAWKNSLENRKASAKEFAAGNRMAEQELIQKLQHDLSSPSANMKIIVLSCWDMAVIDENTIDPTTMLPNIIIATTGCTKHEFLMRRLQKMYPIRK